jgi:hypothetical protein
MYRSYTVYILIIPNTVVAHVFEFVWGNLMHLEFTQEKILHITGSLNYVVLKLQCDIWGNSTLKFYPALSANVYHSSSGFVRKCLWWLQHTLLHFSRNILSSQVNRATKKASIKSKSKLYYDRQSVGTHLGPATNFFLSLFDYFSDSFGFVDVGRPLWREVGSVVYSFCRASPAQPFSDLSPTGLMSIFYCLYFETPSTWRARFLYLYPPGTG